MPNVFSNISHRENYKPFWKALIEMMATQENKLRIIAPALPY